MNVFDRREGALAAWDYLGRKRPRRRFLWWRMFVRSLLGAGKVVTGA